MPYIVENSQGILINADLYLSTETMNFGTQSDAASASNCDVYIEDGYWIQTGGGMIAQNFYLNRGFAPPCDRVTTVSGGVSRVTTLFDHIIIASFSSGNSNDIWLGTSSRVEGKELIFRRVDGSTATVTIRSSQTDIDDGSSTTGDVSQLILTNKGLIRLVRINNTWVNMNFGQ
jgi:hypothetical protein